MGVELPFRVTLASGSKGRRYLMEKWGFTFEVLPANIDEPTEAPYGNCRQYVQHVAWLKAAAVAPQVQEGVIISADTVGWLDDRVIGKPTDRNDARRILRSLSGRTHELWTGVVLWRKSDDLQLIWQERSLVHMRPVTDVELEAYLDSNQWVGCSGAYAIREEDDPFLTVIEGCISNVIGLPMETLTRVIRTFGMDESAKA